MTSSFLLQERLKDPKTWTFGLPDSVMGGQDDHYLRSYGECHPDYMAIPIGNPTGVKVCVRRVDHCGRRFGETPLLEAQSKIEQANGYYRGSVNLYDPMATIPQQDWNPQYYSSRRIPWEQDLLRKDYLRWEIKYNGTGVNLLHSPHELRDKNKPYYQYGYSYTPSDLEGTTWDPRTATDPRDNLPEPKYDVTRLHQPFTVWKDEQRYMGQNQNEYDESYFHRII